MPHWLIIPLFLLLAPPVHTALPPNALQLKVINESGFGLEVLWINTMDSSWSLEPQTTKPLRNGTKTTVVTYSAHSFRFRILQADAEASGLSLEADFVMGPKEAVVHARFSEGRLQLHQSSAFQDTADGIKESMEVCGRPDKDGYIECVAAPVTERIVAATEKHREISQSYERMVQRHRNYTCADEDLQTSPPVRKEVLRVGSAELPVDVLLDTSHAKIWLVGDFIAPAECAVLREYGLSRLERATVYDHVNGSYIMSDKRKAQQTSYTIGGSDDPLANFYHRLFGAVNQKTGYGLRPEGQQGISIIQYNPGDEYAPHCDGACNGDDHLTGGRVATAVCYCEVPKRGGGTTFSKANVYVKPKSGSAVLFSYLGDDGKMDTGLTDHSGCPVLEGEKWLATMWFRKGVTAQRPSHLFDATGVVRSESPH